MKKRFQNLIICFAILLLGGCAAPYKQINPQSLNYSAHDLVDNISISYQYDVLYYRANKKYAKKEQKRDLKLIAVKITNNSDTSITIGKDAFFYGGDNKIVPVEPIIIKKELGQSTPIYLLYGLLSFLQIYQYDKNGNVSSTPIGLVIGPPIAIGNMAMAGSANKKFYMELLDYNTNQRIIQSGETFYGLVGIRHFNFSALTLRRI